MEETERFGVSMNERLLKQFDQCIHRKLTDLQHDFHESAIRATRIHLGLVAFLTRRETQIKGGCQSKQCLQSCDADFGHWRWFCSRR